MLIRKKLLLKAVFAISIVVSVMDLRRAAKAKYSAYEVFGMVLTGLVCRATQ